MGALQVKQGVTPEANPPPAPHKWSVTLSSPRAWKWDSLWMKLHSRPCSRRILCASSTSMGADKNQPKITLPQPGAPPALLLLTHPATATRDWDCGGPEGECRGTAATAAPDYLGYFCFGAPSAGYQSPESPSRPAVPPVSTQLWSREPGMESAGDKADSPIIISHIILCRGQSELLTTH